MINKVIGFTVILLIMLSIGTVTANAADRLILKNVIGKKGAGGGALNSVADITFDRKGNIYVVDSSNYKIVIFNPSGKFLKELGKFGSDPGEINYPYKVAVDPDGNIFVLDYHDLSLVSDPKGDFRNYYRVQKFTPDGTLVWGIGSPGRGESEFNGSPSDIETDKQGNLYVLDRGNFRVQVFDPNGKFLLAFGRYGYKNGEFDYPAYLLIDNNSNIYVSDTSNYRIQKFDKNGKFILAFGKEGYEDGQFKYPYPAQIYFDRENYLCAMTSYSFYTSGKRRFIRCLVQKFDLNGNFKKKIYAVERFYDDDTGYSLSYFNSDAEDNLYLFHSRDKTLNQYQPRGAGINWASMGKNYYLELRKPTEGNNYNYQSATSTTENTRSLTGWNPRQTIYINYEQDDRTNIYLTNDLSLTLLTGPRDDMTIYPTTTNWTSWEGTRDIFSNNSYLQVRRVYDKTKNKDVTYTLGYNYSSYNYKWAAKAPEITEPSSYYTFYTNANVDLADFSDIELGYNKSYSQYSTDSKYSNYKYTSDSPSDYVYLKYHTDF